MYTKLFKWLIPSDNFYLIIMSARAVEQADCTSAHEFYPHSNEVTG